mgnify:FL=1
MLAEKKKLTKSKKAQLEKLLDALVMHGLYFEREFIEICRAWMTKMKRKRRTTTKKKIEGECLGEEEEEIEIWVILKKEEEVNRPLSKIMKR